MYPVLGSCYYVGNCAFDIVASTSAENTYNCHFGSELEEIGRRPRQTYDTL